MKDSHQDWKDEVTKIGHVYSKSLCTLATSMSENSDGGYRVPTRTSPGEENDYPVDLHIGSKHIRSFIREPRDWNREWEKGALCKRAYVARTASL